ncbi:MAG: hypothetical protein FWE22_02945 [Firmicutes bacterium]|nr:hypothetical protein [Bacillota bacterium]
MLKKLKRKFKMLVVVILSMALFAMPNVGCAFGLYDVANVGGGNFIEDMLRDIDWSDLLRDVDWEDILRDVDLGGMSEEDLRNALLNMDLRDILTDDDFRVLRDELINDPELLDSLIEALMGNDELGDYLIAMLMESEEFREFIIELLLELGVTGGAPGGLPNENILRAFIRADLMRDPVIRESYERGQIDGAFIDALVEIMLRNILAGADFLT